jgi:GNAT superfamily N-acetyltransferase
VLIRLANGDDAKQLWGLVEEYIEEEKRRGSPDQRKVLAMAIEYGVRRGEAVVVAEEAGELVGFVVWVAFPDAAEGEVLGAGTYVTPKFRRQLVSVELREFAKDFCRAKGRKYVSGAVWGDNIPALKAAKRTGAQVKGYLVEWPL